jgi:hypothetical protein
VGYEYGTFWNFKFSLFERDQTNLIDYVRYLSTDTQSVAKNFTSAKTRGIDAGVYWFSESLEAEIRNQTNISIQDIGFSYEYLDSRIDRGNIFSSRYAFTHPRHRISARTSATFPYAVKISLDAVHNIKLNNDNYTLLDARMAKHFTSFIIFIRGTNLLNQSYEEIVGVPLPGRWLWAGIEFKLF